MLRPVSKYDDNEPGIPEDMIVAVLRVSVTAVRCTTGMGEPWALDAAAITDCIILYLCLVKTPCAKLQTCCGSLHTVLGQKIEVKQVKANI